MEPPGIAPGSSPLITSAFISIDRASPDRANIGVIGGDWNDPVEMTGFLKGSMASGAGGFRGFCLRAGRKGVPGRAFLGQDGQVLLFGGSF